MHGSVARASTLRFSGSSAVLGSFGRLECGVAEARIRGFAAQAFAGCAFVERVDLSRCCHRELSSR